MKNYIFRCKLLLSTVTATSFPGSVGRVGENPGNEVAVTTILSIGTLSNDDDDGSENVGKKMNLSSFKLIRVYLNPLNMSSTGDFSWS